MVELESEEILEMVHCKKKTMAGACRSTYVSAEDKVNSQGLQHLFILGRKIRMNPVKYKNHNIEDCFGLKTYNYSKNNIGGYFVKCNSGLKSFFNPKKNTQKEKKDTNKQYDIIFKMLIKPSPLRICTISFKDMDKYDSSRSIRD